MWAVGETDMMALSIAGVTANVSFAIGSFLLGFLVNIITSYGGAEKLTDIGNLMLHKVTYVLGGFSFFFYAIGIVMTLRKASLWSRIKEESKPLP
jgi:hypothetical protein